MDHSSALSHSVNIKSVLTVSGPWIMIQIHTTPSVIVTMNVTDNVIFQHQPKCMKRYFIYSSQFCIQCWRNLVNHFGLTRAFHAPTHGLHYSAGVYQRNAPRLSARAITFGIFKDSHHASRFMTSTAQSSPRVPIQPNLNLHKLYLMAHACLKR
jgi:hypothetical protein